VEKIILAAIRCNDGTIFTGKRHSDCILTAIRINNKQSYIGQESQGFITNRLRFINRHDAAEIAFKAKQTKKRHHYLLSEDLW
jgi:hypothetical protein